ncbi:metal ABC transporter solute-binding protein, Zn/Mn family [Candidatus Chlamydia sanziniae]|uniref:Zinc ABC transporter protein ZnuA n=1 Tax=Candidatus Chlamydia sanziniae TaxID=1806891 RepID=A0A1A9HWN3_9CHLA|nr:zinc ABC transporter substrate-binding protein [Candidatus Chlamydia sanziniae]ANH78336.1 Zinc ABC transporter protein ZnuA [Candidatus Chlamydia sanziniae]
MRKILFFIFFILCSLQAHSHNGTEKPQLLVSLVPYKFLVEQISAETCSVYSIVTNHYDPHTYELPPRQMEELRRGELWFRIGEAFEKACEKNLTCEQIDLTQNVSLILGKSCCSEHVMNYDTHIWLSPKNLKIQVQTIVSALSKKYPQYAALYEHNGAELLISLDLLDREILSIISKAKQRHVLVSHPAFGYFCRDYNFFQHYIEKNNHSDPSPKDIVQIFKEIRQYEFSSIILLEYAGRRSSAMLAERFHMNSITLDPYAENVIVNLRTIATTFASL